MKRLMILLGLGLSISMNAYGQLTNPPGVLYVGSAPSGACSQSPPIRLLNSNGHIYTCNNGTWTDITASGSGTVTSFTDSSGLFSVATSTTTPTTTYATQTANTAFGNFTGSTAAPSFTATTGTGSPVAATSPTLVTPALGTPSALVITSATGTCTGCSANIAGGTAQTISVAGAASTPALNFTGTILTGGTGTTNFPHIFYQHTGTAVTTWNTNGTLLGGNLDSGFIGNIIDFRLNGASTTSLSVDRNGNAHYGGFVTASSFPSNGATPAFQLQSTSATLELYNAGIMSWSSTAAYNGAQDVGLDRNAAGIVEVNLGTAAGSGGTLKAQGFLSNANCSSSASPAVCTAATAGSVVVAASATTVVVDTTAVTANSQVFVQEDSSLGTKLSVTCNTTPATAPPTISARTGGTSFTITTTAPTTNPRCFSYWIIN